MGCRIVGGRGRSCPWLGDVRRFRKTIGLTLSNPRWHDAELCRAAPPLAGEIQAQRHQSEFLHSLGVSPQKGSVETVARPQGKAFPLQSIPRGGQSYEGGLG